MLAEVLGELRYTKVKLAQQERAFDILEQQATMEVARAKRAAGFRPQGPTQVTNSKDTDPSHILV